jgi:NDP-sugar pyrophosphorylase family protein
VTNGDSYVGTPLGGFVSWYRESRRDGALLLAWVENTNRFGTVELQENGQVAAFQEKRGLAVPGWINGGIYLLPRRRIEELPAGQSLSLEYLALPKWAREGLSAFCVKAPFIDIGTPESLDDAARFFGRGDASSGKPYAMVRDGVTK